MIDGTYQERYIIQETIRHLGIIERYPPMLRRQIQIFISCCNIPTVPLERKKWWGAACLIYMLFVAFPLDVDTPPFPHFLTHSSDADILL